MSISLYFGLPGCGKTTLLSYLAKKNIKKRQVYGNVHLAIPGYTYIDFECIGKYDLSDSLILIDEATIYADSRNYKNFDHALKAFILLHRHYCCDVVFFAQEWASLDKRIRSVTDRVYYVFKKGFTSRWITSYYRIPYGIIIPDHKKQFGDTLGEIIQGYAKPPLLMRIFCKRLFRPLYYKYFDSWEAPELPPLPSIYQPYSEFDDADGDYPERKKSQGG